jgi:maltose O-acetyltransferase
MTALSKVVGIASRAKGKLEGRRLARRWQRLQEMGMRIGQNVWLPASTWIDTNHCFLISIGDNTGFGEECLILAHDAQMDEFLDATRIGRVVIHESCHIGARCVIMPGVEIGPRAIVGAGSIVTKSLPPNTVSAGNPARVICSLDEYLAKHRERMGTSLTFPYSISLSDEQREAMAAAVANGAAYITGGHSAELRGEGGTPRTPLATPRPPKAEAVSGGAPR